MKTPKQIEKEIKALTEMKPRVKRNSVFGDDHHDAIDAQVEVLTKRMSESSIYDKDGETDPDDDSLWKQNVMDAALSAYRWMRGEEDEAPSEGWKDLLLED